MRSQGRLPGSSLLLLFLFTALSAAWPWPDSLEEMDGHLLRPRATVTSDPGKSTLTGVLPASSGTAAASTGTIHSGHSNTTSHHSTKTTSIDPRLPPGGIEMVTPAAIAGSQYFKVGDYVTFAWNYTSLSVTPTAIDVFASCALNNQLYTITTNMSVEHTGAVTWDTGDYQATATVPLLVATYTLVIYDAAKDVTSIPSAGYLDTYDQYYFGMYTPQAYVPLKDFKCSTCNGAFSDHERQALGVVLLTSVITILSFTWFADSAGLFS